MNILASALIACLLLLAGCASKSQPTASAPPPLDVIVVPVQQKDVPIYGDWVATLDGYVNANIQPQVSGYLIKQDYQEGSYVRKDDVLFEIDPRPFQAALDQAKGQLAQARGQLAQAQAQLALSKINVQRNTPLAKAHAIAQSQLDTDVQAQAQNEALVKTSQASIQAGEAAVEVAELNLGFTKVRSLINGIAGIATTQIGNLVGPSTLLTTVSDVNPIKVYFPISEQEYLRVAGNFTSKVPLQLTLANGSVYPHPGKIAFSNRQVDPQTGTIRMAALFANPGNLLRPGQFGRVRAMTALRKGALLVPQRAVNELQGHYQVAVVGADNRVSIRTVQVGERVGEMWIVESGVSPGDRVISEGVAKVRDGMTVNPKRA
ncbi:MAG TPA: efflux RND transporter periplasmic adaptor subunit [Bryobacteraceae bacterium]